MALTQADVSWESLYGLDRQGQSPKETTIRGQHYLMSISTMVFWVIVSET